MRTSVFSMAWITCTAVIHAQDSPLNVVEVWPDITTGSSRSGIPISAEGDVLLQMTSMNVLGEGQGMPGSVGGRVNGFNATIQDANAATQEKLAFSVRRDDPSAPGKPDVSDSGELLRVEGLLTPPGNGQMSWKISVTLATPVDVLPQTATWYFGVGLPANPALADGLSIHQAVYGNAVTSGDNPRPGAPNITFGIIRSTNNIVQATPPRTHAIGILTEAPVVGLGADIAANSRRGPNPTFGVAGFFPNVDGRKDGIVLRLRDQRHAGATAQVLMGFRILQTPIQMPGVYGKLFLDPDYMHMIGVVTIPADGEVIFQPDFLKQGQVPANVQGTVGYQFLICDKARQEVAASSVVTHTVSASTN